MSRLFRLFASLTAVSLLVAGCSQPPQSAETEAQPQTAQPTPEAEPTPSEEPPELIGGGTEIFPERRFIALYGHPEYAELGSLGEQGPQEAAERVIELAEMYEAHADEDIIPAFEIIATMASAAPGEDGNYSAVADRAALEAYVDAAEEHDIYVVLDLQPGHADFLTQAKLFEDLLTRPNVGLALDPEWRLAPGQVHMQQIGSVSAVEINETTEWLAELTAEHDLPQKLVILHQFRLSMIRGREQVNTDHPELAVVLHADGHGTPEQKMDTWRALKQDLPDNMYMAWKNFFRQDQPMFAPKDTFEIEPKPWFVSYQ
ncbi:hypothetical protein [Enteractinococcus coprophilus]|uniref:Lipoprotein n=1 Tax=Enteractinococcus coprophilus TaxID=1027633 RepID=A0A543AM32_9MICC|nr:hypothetical protein [Enteractinococcus coprophilus]TQL73611.1 hypothetical protein FB556_0052 [Enteractinococcus coprophilus]